jgi:magnesium-transporting ATPase (P-type)
MAELVVNGDTARGLSREAAARRLQIDGANELPAARGRSLAVVALDIRREPMLFLLVSIGIVYLLLGDPREALAVSAEGDRVVADATLVSAAHLVVDESLVTGESAPVAKHVDDTNGRVSTPNRALRWLAAAAVLLLAAVLYWPPRRDLFRLGRPHADDLAVAAGAAALTLAVIETIKFVHRRFAAMANWDTGRAGGTS